MRRGRPGSTVCAPTAPSRLAIATRMPLRDGSSTRVNLPGVSGARVCGGTQVRSWLPGAALAMGGLDFPIAPQNRDAIESRHLWQEDVPLRPTVWMLGAPEPRGTISEGYGALTLAVGVGCLRGAEFTETSGTASCGHVRVGRGSHRRGVWSTTRRDAPIAPRERADD